MGNCSRPHSNKSGDLAPFYSLAAALGKRAAMGLVQRGPVNPRPWAALSAPRPGQVAHEPFFRRAGFSPDADGPAHLAAAAATNVRRGHLRNQTRRRVFDVEP